MGFPLIILIVLIFLELNLIPMSQFYAKKAVSVGMRIRPKGLNKLVNNKRTHFCNIGSLLNNLN